MDMLLPLAIKSFLVAGAVLLVLKLAEHRSASDRSWIAHLGLASLLLLPVAVLALPALEVAGPAFLAERPAPSVPPAELHSSTGITDTAAPTAAIAPEGGLPLASPIDWLLWSYLVPCALLLLLTLVALARLIPLKARATVLVEPHWLSALAHAQRRMGFKNGTALLTSEDLPSPISWGLIRPVILLNSEATKSYDQAEAIIAHELAHVANLDWAKLLVARVAVALFWFNPLVWLLAREAHQLREEAADDAVLASDIEDTDYANLLVGVARHECKGLLIGAHGVAPARNSLSRRVRRVLDGALARAPGGWRWSSAAAFFAAGMAVPVAALTFVPTTPKSALVTAAQDISMPRSPQMSPAATVPDADVAADFDEIAESAVDAGEHAVQAETLAARIAARAEAQAAGAIATASASAGPGGANEAGARALGITPEYAAAMRSAAPQFARIDSEDLGGLKVHNVSPGFVRDLSALGYRGIGPDEVMGAAIQHVTSDYARAIASSGYRGISVEELTEMKLLGVTPAFIDRLRRAGHRGLSVDQVVEARLTGRIPAD